MNLLQKKNLVVFCLLGLALTLSARAQRYSVGDPIGFPRIYSPPTRFGNDIPAGATITLQCYSTYDYDYDNYTHSTVYDGATITWTAKDAYGHDVGQFSDNEGTTAVWTAPTAEGAVTIYATADDDPDYLANDCPQQHYLALDIVKRAYVKSDASGAHTGGSWHDAFTDLQEALELAGAGWEIWVAQGTYYPGDSQTDTFNISGAAVYGGFYGNEGSLEQRSPSTYVTILSGDIDADGLDDGNCYRVVSCSGGTLDGFTIKQGYGDLPGAGLYVSGSMTLTNCIIRDNETTDTGGYGAGAYFGGGSSTVTGCTFTNNTARDDGGGAALVNAGATFSGCTFSTNYSLRLGGDEGEGGDGAGIYIISSTASFDSTCSFSGNEADDDGGGAYVEGCSPSFNGCSFSGNESGEDGGGASNKGSNAGYSGCTFSGNTAGDDGGALCWKDGSDGTVSSSTFTGNSASSNGGAVFISAGDEYPEEVGSSPSFSGCTFQSNSTSARDGGAVMSTQPGSDPSYSGCDFYDNTAGDDGGALQCEDGSDPSISGCEFLRNEASGGNGGAINCNRPEDGEGSSPTITNCTFGDTNSANRNAAHGSGGAIRISGEGSDATITGGSMRYNDAGDNNGGGIYVTNDASATIENVTIEYNTSLSSGDGDGGGICVNNDAYAGVSECTIQYNRAYDQGGGVRVKGGASWSADAYTVDNCLYNLHYPYVAPDDYDNIDD
jgi:predicted outer membrane repeat protein